MTHKFIPSALTANHCSHEGCGRTHQHPIHPAVKTPDNSISTSQAGDKLNGVPATCPECGGTNGHRNHNCSRLHFENKKLADAIVESLDEREAESELSDVPAQEVEELRLPLKVFYVSGVPRIFSGYLSIAQLAAYEADYRALDYEELDALCNSHAALRIALECAETQLNLVAKMLADANFNTAWNDVADACEKQANVARAALATEPTP